MPQTHLRSDDLRQILTGDIVQAIIPPEYELVPDLNETYELQLAHYESQVLPPPEIVRNAAYFASVKGQLTRHFLMCKGEPIRLPKYSSSRLRDFFQANQFKTGYATHGLFPYRGKFHPQMIKGLMNIMGLKPGDTVLDPMMGSGTVLIEASLMGIRSIGVDASPFCRFMTQAKLDGLTAPLGELRGAAKNPRALFSHFRDSVGEPSRGSKARPSESQGHDLFSVMEEAKAYGSGLTGFTSEDTTGRLLLLAYLDSAGYSERSTRRSPFEQFCAILERYLFVAEKIQRVVTGMESEMAPASPQEGDARDLALEDSSVDGVIFSPPYSFAVDYLANDSFHLRFMGVDTEELRKGMVGLRGRTKLDQYEAYVADMRKVLGECARVLRPGRLCTIVVGTNNNQLAKILDVPPEEVRGIHELLVELGAEQGLTLVRTVSRRISGMANTMRTEYIVLLERNGRSQ